MKKLIPNFIAKAYKSVNQVVKCVAVAAMLGGSLTAAAEETTNYWEQILQLPNTYRHYVTKKGTYMVSTLDVTSSGKYGIYVSDDQGKNWTRADVKDWNYSKFAENDEYIFATGERCRVARSNDEGKTWEVMNYQIFIEDVVPPKGIDANTSQGIVCHNGKLYVSDMEGAGVIVSDDNGETWEIVDREGLFIDFRDGSEPVMDTFYNIFSFNGRLYAFGMYTVFRLNEETNKWENLPINSNFMAVEAEYDGMMFCARGAMLEDPSLPLISVTPDGNQWAGIAPPPFVQNRYVRAMTISSNGTIYANCPIHNLIAVTSDFGESWGYIDRMPSSWAMELTVDDEYVYASFFEANPANKNSGLWRFPISHITGIEAVAAQGEGWQLKGGVISFENMAEGTITVTAVDGRSVNIAVVNGQANVSALAKGIYVFRTSKGEVGKFAI